MRSWKCFIDVCATNGPLFWLLLAKSGLPLVALGSLVAQRSIAFRVEKSIAGHSNRLLQAKRVKDHGWKCSTSIIWNNLLRAAAKLAVAHMALPWANIELPFQGIAKATP